MIEFFRGWKRKVGCVTLVLACVFSAGWVRSSSIFDGVHFNFGSTEYTVYSEDGGLWFARYLDIPISEPEPWISWNSAKITEWDGYTVDANGYRQPFVPSRFVYTDWVWNWAGFEFCGGKSKYEPNFPATIGAIPYWFLVLPLTAMSAWFLLSKPRAKIKLQAVPANENAS